MHIEKRYLEGAMVDMDYSDFYYSNVLGYTPEEESSLNRTRATIEYLQDCGFSQNELTHILLECSAGEALTVEMLPGNIWEGSLTKPNRFYYHHTLQITSKPPHYDAKLRKEVIEPYFMEMRIRYTMKDLVDYFYRKLNIDTELMDEKRDSARMQALLKKYEKLSFISALDFVLSLIDYAGYTHMRVVSVFDVEKAEPEVFDELKRKTAEANFHGKNLIVWRK